ncbi:MAG: OmpA family protein [Hyphomicrobiaceae bacterium]
MTMRNVLTATAFLFLAGPALAQSQSGQSVRDILNRAQTQQDRRAVEDLIGKLRPAAPVTPETGAPAASAPAAPPAAPSGSGTAAAPQARPAPASASAPAPAVPAAPAPVAASAPTAPAAAAPASPIQPSTGAAVPSASASAPPASPPVAAAPPLPPAAAPPATAASPAATGSPIGSASAGVGSEAIGVAPPAPTGPAPVTVAVPAPPVVPQPPAVQPPQEAPAVVTPTSAPAAVGPAAQPDTAPVGAPIGPAEAVPTPIGPLAPTEAEMARAPEIAARQGLPTVDIEVQFAYDSSEVTPAAAENLMSLGRALADPRLAGQKFVIAGHTDARGTVAYNLALSERRAQAVRGFLVEHFKIEPDNLLARGFGKSRLKNPRQPLGAENRRVQIINFTPQLVGQQRRR